jgi:LacI family transcriptional regulator
MRRPMRRRVEGFRAAFAARNLVVPEELVVCVDEARDSAFERVKRMLAAPCRPTAIIAQGTNILNECLNAVNAAKLKIPTDISVVTVGDPLFARTYIPPLTTLRLSAQQIADASANLLLARIRGDAASSPPRTLRIAAQWVPRGSCAPAPSAVVAPS